MLPLVPEELVPTEEPGQVPHPPGDGDVTWWFIDFWYGSTGARTIWAGCCSIDRRVKGRGEREKSIGREEGRMEGRKEVGRGNESTDIHWIPKRTCRPYP